MGKLTKVVLALLMAIQADGLARGRAPVPEPSASPEGVASPLPSPSPIASPQPIDTAEGHIGFECVTCTKEEKVKIEKAEILANEIVQGKCFGDFMLSWGLIEREGRSPIEVVDHIRKSKVKVPVHYYYSRKNVVGYRQPPYPDIYFNRRYHDYYNACDTASNGCHETLHVLGYGHPFKPTSTRGRTIPYACNSAFEKCCIGSKGFRGSD